MVPMINAKPFMDKIKEIEKRMDYVIENWKSDNKITIQEVRHTCIAYLYGMYKNEKVEDFAKTYLEEIKERRRLSSEELLTSITAELITKQDFQHYYKAIIKKLKKLSNYEKHNLAVQFLLILTPHVLNNLKDEDKEYIKDLLGELKEQDIEKKLFSYWIDKRLFSCKEDTAITNDQIKDIKEYLLLEIINSGDYNHGKNELREKFIPQIEDYNVDRIDWVVFLIYQFLKKNRICIITEEELNKIIENKTKSAINKKIWFPLTGSIAFILIKLYLEKLITLETLSQTLILILGTIFLFFEERLPSFEIPVKRYRITFGQIGEGLIIASILWAMNISPKRVIEKVI